MRTSHLLPSHAAHALQHICHSFRLISSCMLFSLHNFAAANLKERWRPTGVLWLHVTNCGTAFQFILDKPTDVNFEHGVKKSYPPGFRRSLKTIIFMRPSKMLLQFLVCFQFYCKKKLFVSIVCHMLLYPHFSLVLTGIINSFNSCLCVVVV